MNQNKDDINFNFKFPIINKIPAKFVLKDRIDQTEYLCNGELQSWTKDKITVLSPIFCCKNEDSIPEQIILGSYPSLDEEEALKILDSSINAYNNGNGAWPSMKVEDRIKCVEKFVYLMQDNKDEIVNLLMWEIAKSHIDSEKEFDRTVKYIIDTIDALKTLDRNSSKFLKEESIIAQIRRSPLGIVLCMGPFNYPLNETFTTLIPALIMGNVVIFKPPKHGILLFRPLLKAFKEAFPPGVINTLYGRGRTVASALMATGKINCLAFIGTSKAADSLQKTHPMPHRLRMILGLEAKNPAIVLSHADITVAVKECLLGALSFNGQRCTALKILFVHSEIVNDFLKKLSDEIEKLKINSPFEDDVFITPMPTEDRVKYFLELIEDAKMFGAKVINKFGGSYNKTYFYPTILYPVNKKARIYHEEQFGPIIPVVPFSDIDEPLKYITESNYGQQASIFGSDPDEMAKIIDALVNQVCRVNLNSQCQRGPDIFPFTGRKDSAVGTLSVSDALRSFSIRTLVAAKSSDLNKHLITKIVKENKSQFLSRDFIL
ncbi:Glyceraldehyde-3-phosphate dehydrogenase (NADP(+)) [Thermodesulfobium narugense DSM 14796]|uniref:Glyceraldehyde-3-phosphate dehydrogenase (NADP(+)) n=1 Tax=Thermodesulfobium narugense DSM 14796 TaxID=747365 RepID=M1E8I9_9BACT|nr:NADP-dependent glyceraldehyde-3-phosphate dehydrogenase [Thermodesulfobium narugense]AEE14504.1 Glyceraldehyde-3-phosphate dehydrogenase (NADP(+)) [Thermodesulfobium narugense DSM 14796]